MSDFKQDPVTGDLVIENNELVRITGAEEIVQRIIQRLRTFRGEWFLDRSVGLPYYQDILIKNPNVETVQGLFRQAILKTPGVTRLLQYSQTLDGVTRKLTINFKALGDVGVLEAEITV